jgi:hypothetical protein
VVLPLVVVHEFDKNKTNTKKLDDGTVVKTRARKTLNRIDELIPTGHPTKRAVLTKASCAVPPHQSCPLMIDTTPARTGMTHRDRLHTIVPEPF